MTNLLFLLWLILYQIGHELCHYINSLYNKTVYTDQVKGFSALLTFVFYFYIASLLYNK